MGYKTYSDSYLMSLTKSQIIELLKTAEHNFFATEEALNNSAKAGMEIAEKYDRAKQLLKAAVEDFVRIDEVKLLPENTIRPMLEYTNIIDVIRHKWRYADEALALIGDDTNVGGKIDSWIRCKDKMPEDNTSVLFVYVSENGIKSVHYGYHQTLKGLGSSWAKLSGGLQYCDDDVTHWQPVPEPPKDGDNNA